MNLVVNLVKVILIGFLLLLLLGSGACLVIDAKMLLGGFSGSLSIETFVVLLATVIVALLAYGSLLGIFRLVGSFTRGSSRASSDDEWPR